MESYGTISSTGNFAQCYMQPGWEGNLGNGYMYVYG